MLRYKRLKDQLELEMERLSNQTPQQVTSSSSRPASRLSSGRHQEEFHSQFSEEDFQRELRESGSKVVGPGGVFMPRREELGRLLDNGEDSISVMCFTWNLAGKSSLSLPQLNSLFAKMSPRERPSLIALALQEVPPSTLLSLLDKFHASVVQSVGQALTTTHRVFCWVRKWSQMLVLFIRRRLSLFTSHPEYRFVAGTNMARPFRTKGAIAICFRVLQCRCVFIACHLTHGKLEGRILDYHKMARSFDFEWRPRGNSAECANVFWFGDLNFRVRRTVELEAVARNLQERLFRRQADFEALLTHDELSEQRQKGLFEGFREGTIKFPPTHKFMLGTSLYAPNRMPSYTDRVLFRSFSSDSPHSLVAVRYDCIWEVTCSDHKPVYCTFRMRVLRKNQNGSEGIKTVAGKNGKMPNGHIKWQNAN